MCYHRDRLLQQYEHVPLSFHEFSPHANSKTKAAGVPPIQKLWVNYNLLHLYISLYTLLCRKNLTYLSMLMKSTHSVLTGFKLPGQGELTAARARKGPCGADFVSSQGAKIDTNMTYPVQRECGAQVVWGDVMMMFPGFSLMAISNSLFSFEIEGLWNPMEWSWIRWKAFDTYSHQANNYK